MERPNIYSLIPKQYRKDNYLNPNKRLPIKHPFRLCIIGGSGMGKTSTLIWLIEESQAFHKMYLYAKKLDEPLYKFFIDEWEKRSEKQDETLIEHSENLDDVVHLQDLDESIQNLIIFDDMIVEKNLKKVEELFVRGRKSNCSVVFLSQSYFKIPQIIRQNSNYFILTKGLSGRNLTNIASDHSGTLESDEFKRTYRRFTRSGDVMLIDTVHSKLYKNLGLEKEKEKEKVKEEEEV